ncbi:2-amino-5-chloromuconic acid deaminase [Paraburkholderia caffeinitolerans]|uniref:2-amino-5-chloromuconic acid deaminase n=1 Tax=Paraburkholderia caffeinitolerans TaxID=1723730 RepID=A0A6J5G6D7_9BURK|nr:amidase [Paraburkholderia caffeinitolerans]CAB3793032.1 2-amino-5-chloromuconic acid deaminase [Paraburkholderia caffeinitolerans]
MLPTLDTLRARLADRQTDAAEVVASCVARIEDSAGEGRRVFPHGASPSAMVQAEASDAMRRFGVAGPLAGIPVSVKDLFDIQGEVTRAGSRALSGAPAARDAVAIGRLRAAGAVLVGRTNMTEFAYSGLGINPHFGTPANPFDRAAGRIPGGSSSGAAVSVTDGMAAAGIGSDTGGSCRIPAALCGVAGFKPTAARIPLQGAVPLSTSYDSVGSMAPSVACCAALDSIMAGELALQPYEAQALAGLRFAVPSAIVMEGLDAHVAAAFERAIARLSAAGAFVKQVAFDSWQRLGALGEHGGLVAMEAWSWHVGLIKEHAGEYDPRVLSRIRLGSQNSIAEYLRMKALRSELCLRADNELQPYDAVVCPTVPIVAPRIADLAEESEYTATNRLLLRNPAIANMLDLCAVSIPCHAPGDAPVGLMLMGRHMSDRRLLSIGMGVENVVRQTH